MKLRLVKLALTVSLCYLITEALWKPLFLVGGLPGPYWLFIILEPSVFIVSPLAALMFAISSVALIFWRRVEVKPNLLIRKYGLTCISILTAIVVCAWTILLSFAQHGSHVQTLPLTSRTYQLAVYPLFDVNYVLYECDHSCIVCWKIYDSPDIMREAAHLALDDSQQYVNVVLSNSQGETILYRHLVKQP